MRSIRSYRHWTPRYAVDCSLVELYERKNPDLPWMTRQAIQVLSGMLRPDDIGLEFGSGRSTVWFAGRTGRLTSIEHDESWQRVVSQNLRRRGLRNTDCIFVPDDPDSGCGGENKYARTALRFTNQSLDFVVVDGIQRDFCARLAIPKIRTGGMLVVDNVNRYLPSSSRAPGSRRPDQGAATPMWSEVLEILASWRQIWTSNGVWDTAVYIKP